MRPEILALFIPIVFFIGLFAVIAFNIYFKYKSNSTMSERMPPEALGEWYRSNAQVKAQIKASRNRGTGLRISGLLIGIGLGVAIGCIILACGGISRSTGFDREAIATFLVISLAILFGGAGMIGAWFLERKIDEKSK